MDEDTIESARELREAYDDGHELTVEAESGSDGETDGGTHTEPLYHLRQAIRYADGTEEDLLRGVHNEIIAQRGESDAE